MLARILIPGFRQLCQGKDDDIFGLQTQYSFSSFDPNIEFIFIERLRDVIVGADRTLYPSFVANIFKVVRLTCSSSITRIFIITSIRHCFHPIFPDECPDLFFEAFKLGKIEDIVNDAQKRFCGRYSHLHQFDA